MPPPNLVVCERRGSDQRPLPLLRDLRQGKVLMHLKGIAQEVAGLRRQRGPLATRETAEGVVERALEDHIHSWILRCASINPR